MTTEPHLQSKRPVSALLAGPYGHPVHPMLVTVPIGAWVGSLVFDVASFVVDDPGFLVRGSMWLIALGVIGALAAATVGFLDLFAIPPGTRAFRVGLVHMALNLLVTVAYAGNFLWRHADSDRTGSIGAGMFTLSVLSMAVLGASGYLGGKLAYGYGVRVADESTQSAGFTPLAPDSGSHTGSGSGTGTGPGTDADAAPDPGRGQ